MPRPPRPLDPLAGPVQAFAAELRGLRDQAGNPKYLQMARISGRSRTALAEAAGGDHLPTWETVAAFVNVCKGDVHAWRAKWEQVRSQVRENGNVGSQIEGAQAVEAENTPTTTNASKPTRRRHYLPYLATALTTALVAVCVMLLIPTGTSGSSNNTVATPTAGSISAAVIAVQNKVAVGADQLIEDSTPVYLSTKTIPDCTREGCKVSGTEMSSGAMLVAVCHVEGSNMSNYNLDSSESEQNPHRVNSTLWYRVILHDGRTGYLSEIHIVPADRGGKRLPSCR